MYDLSVIGPDGNYLILAAEDGTRFRIPLNALPKSAESHSRGFSDTNRASVRDIQALIREGLSVGEVARKLSTTVERVKKFEPPVAAERSHITSMALNAPQGDKSFGEALLEALKQNGVLEYKVFAKKGDSAWVLGVEYMVSETLHYAEWFFDHRDMSLKPVNDEAKGLVPEQKAPAADAFEEFPREMDFGNIGDITISMDSKIGQVEDLLTPTFSALNDVAVAKITEPLLDDSAKDLVDSLRRRHRESIDEASESHSYFNSHTTEDVEKPLANSNIIDINSRRDNSEKPESLVADSRNNRRTSVPSWDEILFGSDKPKS